MFVDNKILSIAFIGCILVFYSIFYYKMHGAEKTIKNFFIWIIIIMVSFVFFNSNNIVNIDDGKKNIRIFAGSGCNAKNQAIYKKSDDGHFYIDALIGHTFIRFIVDTGASGIALTPQDAKKLGISIQSLSFTEEYETASGIIKAAPIVIPEMKIACFVIQNVSMSINESGSGISLLGMSLLKNFDITIKPDSLILSEHQNESL